MLQLWECRPFRRCKSRRVSLAEPTLIWNLRTVPRSLTSMTSQETPQPSASTIPALGPSSARASHPPRNRARNHSATGTTRAVGEMVMDLHFPLTSENREGRRNVRRWRLWMRGRERKKTKMTFSGTSRAGRCRRTNGAIAKSSIPGL